MTDHCILLHLDRLTQRVCYISHARLVCLHCTAQQKGLQSAAYASAVCPSQSRVMQK